MKFLTPILQGVIILILVSLVGGGIKVYAEFEAIKTRVQILEQSIDHFDAKLTELPLCRSW